jgi:hypothetical protein
MRFRFEDDVSHQATFTFGMMILAFIAVATIMVILEYFFGLSGFLIIPLVAFGFPIVYVIVNVIISMYERFRKRI